MLTYERLRSLPASPASSPLLVFGNQKSGTSAIAAILGFAVGRRVKLDFAGAREPMLSEVVSGRQSVEDFVRRNAWAFSYPIVKEPGLTAIALQLLDHFRLERGVFVIRNPWSNIRSICNRLGLDGRDAVIPEDARITATWRTLLEGGRPGDSIANPIEGLAVRWRDTAEVYLSRPDRFVLVRYEDFRYDKLGMIRRLAERCGLSPCKTVSDTQLEAQYQPPGASGSDPRRFFGPEHFELIGRICSSTATRFGYRADAL